MNTESSACALADRTCEPCRGGVPPLRNEALTALKDQIDPEWHLVGEHHLERTFRFRDFRQALDFTCRVGELAETLGHHPEIALGWGRVALTLWTHKIDGLSEADFVLAARIDRLSGATSA